MPQKNNSGTPPKTMTWAKAAPVIAVAAVFYVLRLMFEQFWFFGPALAGVICTAEVGGKLTTWTMGLLGTKTAAAACGAGAVVAGSFGAPVIETFGVVMAMAIGLLGWLTIGIILLMTNARIFKENKGNTLWFIGGLFVSEIPIIGTLPGTLGSLYRMYKVQIKNERAALRAYEKAQAARQKQAQEEQRGQLAQARIAQVAEAEQAAANDAEYEETEAANDDQYTQTMDKAA